MHTYTIKINTTNEGWLDIVLYKLYIYNFSFLWTGNILYSLFTLLFLLNTISWKSLYTNQSMEIFFFLLLTAVQFSILCIYYSVINQSPMFGHLDSFQFLAVTNNATKNNFVHMKFDIVGSRASG